jgi:hypothetical protein
MRITQNLKKVKIVSLKKGIILSHSLILPVLAIGEKLGIWRKIEEKLKINLRSRGYSISEKIASLVSLLVSGGNALDHIQLLRKEEALPLLLNVDSLPAPTTLGKH